MFYTVLDLFGIGVCGSIVVGDDISDGSVG